MVEKLGLIIKSKIALAAIGATLVAGGGATVAAAATGAHVPLIGQTQTSAGQGHDANDDHGNDANKNQNEDQNEFEAKGAVASVNTGGSSFVLTLSDKSTVTVTTSDKTVFDGGLTKLGDLKTGAPVEVKGAKQSDGSIAASRVHGEDAADNENENEFEATGTVTSIDTTNASFVLKMADGSSVTVTTSATTEFNGDGPFHSLTDLKTGMTVEVRGAKQSDGSIAATQVKNETEGDNSGSGDTSGSGSGSSGSGGSGSGGSGGSGSGGSGSGGGDDNGGGGNG
jgi:Domain of unknown function (DUF5666)